jgi:hypothetical protein
VPPPALAAHLAATAARSPAAPSPEASPGHLVALGHRLLARVTAAPAGGRELALDLLAADAFVTYAFEAQAEADVDGLTDLAERVDRAPEGRWGGGGASR